MFTSKLLFRIAVIVMVITSALTNIQTAYAAPPANDNFADAEAILSLPLNAAVDISEAGIEPGEPQPCFDFQRSIWYSFTPTENITVRLDTQGSAVDSNVNVYRASGLGIENLSWLGCTAFKNGLIAFLAEAGQTYYLQAGALFGQIGTIQVNLIQALPPINDNFTNAGSISSLPFSDMVDISGATFEINEPINCNIFYAVERTVWYSFTPTESVLVRADTLGTVMPDNLLNIYRAIGPGIFDLEFLSCVSPFSSNRSATFLAEAGQTYYLQTGALFDEVGIFQVNLKQLFPPPNDNFADAVTITTLPFSETVDITDATRETDEPPGCDFLDRTVWYSFTPVETMVVQVDKQGSAINNGEVSIYRSSGPGLSGLQFVTCAPFNTGSTSFIAEAGQTYYLQVGSAFGEEGAIQINLARIPPPGNNNFANAISISSLPSAIDFDTTGATFESGEPVPACAYPSPPYRSIWFAFTATQDRYVTASLPRFGFPPFLAIYNGTGFYDLTELGCSQYGNPLTFHISAGQTYYFQVGGLNGEGGTGTFLLELPPPPVAGFSFYPADPSKYETVQFNNGSYDPVGLGIQTTQWDFGGGNLASGDYVSHSFAADGDYPVTIVVTTVDGRTASFSQMVNVRTHDVSIVKVAAPKSATVGQTRAITVSVRNIAYPEMVQIDLYKSVPGGSVWIATLTKPVPALSGNRTTSFTFDYTFTSQDAQIGKVTFRAVATILNARDALPADNEAISSPSTIVR